VTFGSLFAGIGGMDLGLERAGLKCRWQVEIDPYARRVLANHWPDVPKHDDVKTFPPEGDWHVDVIAGGFPCQDLSYAGKGAGLAGERSGLWYEFARIVRDLRPRYVVVENVPALLTRGLDAVLGTLASLGFDAEWESIPASSLGAPHRRDRVFILAHSDSERCEADGIFARESFEASGEKHSGRLRWWPGRVEPGSSRPDRLRWVPDASVCRVVDGLSSQLDRYRVLGNAVVPQVAQFIGERLMAFDKAMQEMQRAD
jgi:DNA (cytosine-5)-methyltransferase 1